MRSQKLYMKTQNGEVEMSAFVQRVITPDVLKATGLKAPSGFTVEQYADSFSLAYEIGHAFMLNDIKKEQEYQDEQFARVLDEHDEHFYHDDEQYAKELQQQYNKGETSVGGEPSSKGEQSSANSEKRGKGPKQSKSSSRKANVDVTALVDEIKDAVTENVSASVVNVFEKMFTTDMQRSFVFLKSKTTLKALTVLNDFGAVIESKDLGLALVSKQTGVQYAGSGGSSGGAVKKTQYPQNQTAPYAQTPVKKESQSRNVCSFFSRGTVSQKVNVGGGDVVRNVPSRGTVLSERMTGSVVETGQSMQSINNSPGPPGPMKTEEDSGESGDSGDEKGNSDEDDDNPFTETIDQLTFGMAIRSPNKRKCGSQRGGTPKKKQALTLTQENADKPENQDSLLSMASSKQQQISLATSLLAVKRNSQSHDIVWTELEGMNRGPSKGPENPHSFLKIAVKYFPQLKDLDTIQAVNMLRGEMSQFMLVNNQYLNVREHFITYLIFQN